MQLESRHRFEGHLGQAQRGLLVHVEDGGIWAIDTDADPVPLLGKRVKVEGTRSGYDRIRVEWIVAA